MMQLRQRSWGEAKLPKAWSLLLLVVLTALAAGAAQAEETRSAPSDKSALGALFAAKQKQLDADLAQMLALARELAERPLASAAQSELAQIDARLAELADLSQRNTDPAALLSGKQVARAALSLADRLIARAEAKAALAAAEARAVLAEARARTAQAAVQQAEHAIELARARLVHDGNVNAQGKGAGK